MLFKTTEVVNVRDIPGDWHDSDDYVYIGRGSKWGNPYRIGEDGSRDEVIALYREHISNSFLRFSLHELYGKKLVCFCKPKACHGDVLVDLIHGQR